MRFTIRDLLWLTVMVAILVAWWLDRSRLADELRNKYWVPHMGDGISGTPLDL